MSVVFSYLIIGCLVGIWDCIRKRYFLHLLLMEFLRGVSWNLAETKSELSPHEWKKLINGFNLGTHGMLFLTSAVTWPFILYQDVRKVFKKEDGNPS